MNETSFNLYNYSTESVKLPIFEPISKLIDLEIPDLNLPPTQNVMEYEELSRKRPASALSYFTKPKPKYEMIFVGRKRLSTISTIERESFCIIPEMEEEEIDETNDQVLKKIKIHPRV